MEADLRRKLRVKLGVEEKARLANFRELRLRHWPTAPPPRDCLLGALVSPLRRRCRARSRAPGRAAREEAEAGRLQGGGEAASREEEVAQEVIGARARPAALRADG